MAKQNEQAISSGSFHNDIVSLANEEVLFFIKKPLQIELN